MQRHNETYSISGHEGEADYAPIHSSGGSPYRKDIKECIFIQWADQRATYKGRIVDLEPDDCRVNHRELALVRSVHAILLISIQPRSTHEAHQSLPLE